jgi:SAM-dependent methyltransferase
MPVASSTSTRAKECAFPRAPLALCRICSNAALEDLGPIHHPDPAHVAGVMLDVGDAQYRLLRCTRCAFQFKHPPIPQAALLKCYEQASASHWQEAPNPRKRRFDILKRIIEAHAPSTGRNILDIGCFNGALLHYLGDSWHRFGVEPSRQAAAVAQQRGVMVLGATIDDIPRTIECFDVILLIDVLEHIADPLPLFAVARGVLRRGGVIVIGTGDTDAWMWRMQKGRYWYCGLPEHVSFFCRTTLARLAAINSMRSVLHTRVSHVRSSPTTVLRQGLANLAYEASWRCKGLGIGPLRTRIRRRGAPGWLTARDHLIHVMQAQ